MNDNGHNKKVVTVQEFSNETGVPPSTVRRWLQKKEIKGTLIGRKWLIPIVELERIINPSTD